MKKKVYCPRFLTGTEFNWISNVEEVDCPEKADIIVFSGGADINPELYKCAKHYSTYFNKERDALEVGCFNNLSKNQLVIGLCRGAQLITALNGGKLIQNVSGHCSGPHSITNGEIRFKIESIHHQMMYPFDMDAKDYKVLYWSTKRLSSIYEGDGIEVPKCEPEIVLYNQENYPTCLAIQGHPEMMKPGIAHEIINGIIKTLI